MEHERNKNEASSTNTDGTNVTSALTLNNPGAYNFTKENSVTSVIHNDNATVWLATETATLGAAIYLPEDDDSSLRSTADSAFEDYDTGNEDDGNMKFARMENVTRKGQ